MSNNYNQLTNLFYELMTLINNNAQTEFLTKNNQFNMIVRKYKEFAMNKSTSTEKKKSH